LRRIRTCSALEAATGAAESSGVELTDFTSAWYVRHPNGALSAVTKMIATDRSRVREATHHQVVAESPKRG
jgi:hypothetical protein